MFGNIGPRELILILVIVLVIFGPGKLPKVGGLLVKQYKVLKKLEKEKAAKSILKEIRSDFRPFLLLRV